MEEVVIPMAAIISGRYQYRALWQTWNTRVSARCCNRGSRKTRPFPTTPPGHTASRNWQGRAGGTMMQNIGEATPIQGACRMARLGLLSIVAATGINWLAAATHISTILPPHSTKPLPSHPRPHTSPPPPPRIGTPPVGPHIGHPRPPTSPRL